MTRSLVLAILESTIWVYFFPFWTGFEGK